MTRLRGRADKDQILMSDSRDIAILESLQRFAERLHWFSIGRSPEDGLETDKVRMLLEDWDTHVAPALAGTQDRQIFAQFEQLLPVIVATRARVRFMFIVGIHKLLEARVQWLMWEKAVTAPAMVNQRLAEATPEDRVIMLAAIRKMMGREYDAAALYQHAMEMADQREAAWHKSFELFRKEWDEECTPELESRLTNSDATSSALWMSELLSEMMSLQAKHPPLGA